MSDQWAAVAASEGEVGDAAAAHEHGIGRASCSVSLPKALGRGLLRHCPCCGGGRLFRGWFQMKPRCPTCGHCFEREEGFFLGAFVINFAVMQASVGIALLVGLWLTLPDPPVLLLGTVTFLFVAAVCTFAYPFSKTIWAAIDIAFQRDRDVFR